MSDVCFFFFKQKTAYEMRISDWSSDVCSSDLLKAALGQPFENVRRRNARIEPRRPLVARQWNDLTMMIRRDVGPAIHREQRERLAVLIFAPDACHAEPAIALRSEEHTSELQSLMRISYAAFCLKKKTTNTYIYK